MKYVRRFVFVHYGDLLEVRFRQLEKVTDKLYVFVPSDVAEVPFWLVRQMQDMGRDLVWVDVGESSYEEAQLALAFYAGHLHAQADPGVEFALLSDASAADALVRFMRASGREAQRVRRRSPAGSGASEPEGDGDAEAEDLDAEVADGRPDLGTGRPPYLRQHAAEVHPRLHREIGPANGSSRAGAREPLASRAANGRTGAPPAHAAEVTALAEDIVRKLVRSGQRPGDLRALRSYILLHGAEAADHRVDDVVDAMVEKGEVEVEGGELAYGF